MSKTDILSRPRILLIVKLIVLNKGRILLIKRSAKETFNSNKWEIPGGKVNKGKDLGKAFEEKLIEETCLYAHAIKELVFYESDIDGNPKYMGIPYIKMTGLYSTETERVKLTDAHSEYKWATFPQALEMDLADYTRKSLLGWEKEIKDFFWKSY